ncbi:MAG: WxcM-like domain-containing protein [Fuerstiella sp.]
MNAPSARKPHSAFIHSTADVSTSILGRDVQIQQYVIVHAGVEIGDFAIVHPHCLIGPDATIGEAVTLHSGVHIGAGSRIERGVSVESNSVLQGRSTTGKLTRIQEHVSIGAQVVVAAGVEVGQNAQVENGSVVTTDVPPGARVAGNPARIRGYRDASQTSLKIHQPTASAIAGVKSIRLRQVSDLRGTLTVCQWDQQLPFVPQRVFFLHGVPSEKVRGAHAHKECVQVLVCINGSVNVLLDDGTIREECVLNSSAEGLLIPPGVWATQYGYSPNSMLVVFASHEYDNADYIRDYDEFLTYRRSYLDSAA